VVSKKSLDAGGVEVYSRSTGKAEVVAADQIADKIKEVYK